MSYFFERSLSVSMFVLFFPSQRKYLNKGLLAKKSVTISVERKTGE